VNNSDGYLRCWRHSLMKRLCRRWVLKVGRFALFVNGLKSVVVYSLMFIALGSLLYVAVARLVWLVWRSDENITYKSLIPALTSLIILAYNSALVVFLFDLRRIGHTPRCLQCDYQYDEQARPQRCPECGADLRQSGAVTMFEPWRPRLLKLLFWTSLGLLMAWVFLLLVLL